MSTDIHFAPEDEPGECLSLTHISVRVPTVAFANTGPPFKRARLTGPDGGLQHFSFPTVARFPPTLAHLSTPFSIRDS